MGIPLPKTKAKKKRSLKPGNQGPSASRDDNDTRLVHDDTATTACSDVGSSALPSLEVGPPVGIAFYIHIDTYSSRFGTIHVHDEVLNDFDALVAGNC